ncbi:MAG: hypothetical protein LBJ75_00100 [Puniceicoccales bacterium]|jgi:hypothetical protein|nr:hypothetical protein [Puniceicoccales bacterium]
MKKLLGIAVGILSAVGLCAEDIASDLTLETSVQFQTERVFRGRNEFHKALTPQVKIGYPVCDEGNIYVGVDTAIDFEGSSALNQVVPYVGVLWDVTELFTVDAGYECRFHTSFLRNDEIGPSRKHSNELHGGVILDVLLEPSLYCFYDFTRRELTVEGRVRYNFDLSQYAFSGLGVDFGAKVGFDQANKPYAFSLWEAEQVGDVGKKSYCYYGINADLTYELNNNAKTKVGVAYEGNSAEQKSWVNDFGGSIKPAHRNNIWVKASVDCSF